MSLIIVLVLNKRTLSDASTPVGHFQVEFLAHVLFNPSRISKPGVSKCVVSDNVEYFNSSNNHCQWPGYRTKNSNVLFKNSSLIDILICYLVSTVSTQVPGPIRARCWKNVGVA